MIPNRNAQCRKWRRRNRDKVSEYNKRYYQKTAEARREVARKNYRVNSERKRTKNAEFTAKHPNYWRERWERTRFNRAWLKWTNACAASREQS